MPRQFISVARTLCEATNTVCGKSRGNSIFADAKIECQKWPIGGHIADINPVVYGRKIGTMRTLDPKLFAQADYAQAHAPPFNEYAELRALGTPRTDAVIEAFEMIAFDFDMSNVELLARALDINPYVKAKYKEALEAKSIKADMWSEKEAVSQLLRIIKDPSNRESTRLNAIVHLNVLCGYVVIDDDVNDRPAAGHGLKDYQRAHEDWLAAGGVAH